MLQVPHDIAERFEAAMQSASITENLRPHFRRWLRFYLDFCAKYGFDSGIGSSFRQFNAKLRDEGQEEWKRKQAHQAVSLYIRHVVSGGVDPDRLRAAPDEQGTTPVSSGVSALAHASGDLADDVIQGDPASSCGSVPAKPSRIGDQNVPTRSKRTSSETDQLRRSTVTTSLLSSDHQPEVVSSSSRSVGVEKLRQAPAWSAGSELSIRETVSNPRAYGRAPAIGSDTKSSENQNEDRSISAVSGENAPTPTGVSWVWVYDKLEAAIKVRHYSPRTLKSYRSWTRKLQSFTKSKDPKSVSIDDVKDFLTFLAVKKKVAVTH